LDWFNSWSSILKSNEPDRTNDRTNLLFFAIYVGPSPKKLHHLNFFDKKKMKLKFILFFRKKIEKDICQKKMKRDIGYVG